MVGVMEGVMEGLVVEERSHQQEPAAEGAEEMAPVSKAMAVEEDWAPVTGKAVAAMAQVAWATGEEGGWAPAMVVA